MSFLSFPCTAAVTGALLCRNPALRALSEIRQGELPGKSKLYIPGECRLDITAPMTTTMQEHDEMDTRIMLSSRCDSATAGSPDEIPNAPSLRPLPVGSDIARRRDFACALGSARMILHTYETRSPCFARCIRSAVTFSTNRG